MELSASVALLVEVEDLVDRDPAVQDPAVQDLAVQDPVVQDPVVQDPVVQDPVVQDPVVQDLADRVLADQDLADRDLVVTVQEFPLEAKLTLALAVESAAVEVDQAVPAAEIQSIRQTPTWSTSTAIVLEPVTTVINQINTVFVLSATANFTIFRLVGVHCRDTKIEVLIKTNKPFSGRVYALGRSETCNIDVQNSDSFRLDLSMNGGDCNTQSMSGMFTNTIVLQHHSVVMTKGDKIYKIKCTYDMSPRNVSFGMMPIRLFRNCCYYSFSK